MSDKLDLAKPLRTTVSGLPATVHSLGGALVAVWSKKGETFAVHIDDCGCAVAAHEYSGWAATAKGEPEVENGNPSNQ
jgi:hypothetical protein